MCPPSPRSSLVSPSSHDNARQNKQKNALFRTTSTALINGDCKEFSFKTDAFVGSVGFAVIETTDSEVILSRTEEIIIELVKQKSAQGLSALFLAVVNIVELKSTLLLCGDNERSLGAASFPDCKTNRADQPFSMDLGQRVSRKKDFLPSVNKAVKAGWTPVVVTQSN